MTENPYRLLQQRLDELPNGFPPADDGSDLRLLARLFTPDEAALASKLRLTLETAAELAARTGATLVPCFALRRPDDSYEVRVEPPAP